MAVQDHLAARNRMSDAAEGKRRREEGEPLAAAFMSMPTRWGQAHSTTLGSLG